MTTKQEIKKPQARMFRRLMVKRRRKSDGLFEPVWQDISDKVKKWGTIKKSIDAIRPFKFQFSNLTMKFENIDGFFNPEDDHNSFWFGFASQQRTLFKIEAGFLNQTLSSSGIWINKEFPENTLWDEAKYDDEDEWDNTNSLFVGVLAGDIPYDDKANVTINIKPLHKIFQDYPARNLSGYASGGLVASTFMDLVRDHTDGSGGFIFRPFFGGSTGGFEISTTIVNYTDLNTFGAKHIRDKNCWEVIEKLSEAELFVPLITRDGKFRFQARDPNTTTVAFEFHGEGSRSTEFGHTIKRISRFGKRMTRYFSRVEVRYAEEDTSTSFVYVEESLTVSGINNTWNFGHRTFKIENFYIPNSSTAQTVANATFNNVTALKDEIEFETSFVPNIEILDRISLDYDSSGKANPDEVWDLNDWDTELSWDSTKGNAIKLVGKEFDLLSIELNIDKFSSKFIGRAV